MTHEFDGEQGSSVASGIFNRLSWKGKYLGYKKDMNFVIKIAWAFGAWGLGISVEYRVKQITICSLQEHLKNEDQMCFIEWCSS